MVAMEISAAPAKWSTLKTHRLWLLQQADALFSFFERQSLNPLGGFYELDDQGRPLAPGAVPGKHAGRQIHVTTRMVHCFSIAHLLGRPGADTLVDHGMDFLWNGHRDARHGGYFWGVGYEGPTNDTKQAYGHAFVLLAASSAKVAGHPDADRLLTDISTVLSERFWEDAHGAVAEEFTRDWQPYDSYRGQNSNMHLTEALMAAFEATGDGTYLAMAERIADLIIRRHSAAAGWRLPEHFTTDWQVDRDYSGDPMFRPYGTTPGHSLEWARLLLQLWELGGRKHAWLPDAARNLFGQAHRDGWDHRKGRLLLHARMGRLRPHQGSLLVALLRSHRCGRLPQRHRRRQRLRGMVPPHLELLRHPLHRPRQWRLARPARRRPQAQCRPLLRQARHLSRAPGLPDPAAADQRQHHQWPGPVRHPALTRRTDARRNQLIQPRQMARRAEFCAKPAPAGSP